ncbi:MAG: uncharacterized protein QOD06_3547 [Candidatus Binatota bacterium]|nr:uncharacterized protein [Candidatus Binatota bacterium]
MSGAPSTAEPAESPDAPGRPRRGPSLLARQAIAHPFAALGAMLLLILAALWANGRVFDLRGGILDDALPEDDVYRQMDRAVKAKAPAGFAAGEVVPIVVALPALTAENLREVLDVTREAKRVFGNGVVSLATLPDYRDDGTTLVADAYLTEEGLAHLDLAELRRRVAADPSVHGIFVAKDWSWASIAVFLPPGYDETREAWRFVEFLEGKKLSTLERFLKDDIHPRDPRLGVVGWVMGRWQIGQGINRDLMLFVALGVTFASPICWWYLRSLRQALVCAAVIVTGILLTRGSIWLLNVAGFGTFERVYTELAYANIIVQGTSFTLHVFEAFRSSRAPTSRAKLLEALHVVEEIRLVVLIAVVGFACLFTFPVWQMREMAIQSISGVLFIYLETVVLLPSLYLALERCLGAETPGRHFHPVQFTFARIVGRMRAPRWLSWTAPLVTFAIGVALFAGGAIATKTEPEEYIAGTRIAATFDDLRRSGSGNEFLDLLIEPRRGRVFDPAFVAAAWSLEVDLARAAGGRGFEAWQRREGFEPVQVSAVGSILGKLHQIARASYGEDIPSQPDRVRDAFAMIEEELPAEVRTQLWFDGGVRLLVSAEMNDSEALRALVERLLRFANERYGSVLSARVFGKAPVYPQVDAYVTRGEGPNVLLSLCMIFLIYAGWIAWRRRRSHVPVRPFVGGYVMVSPFLFAAGVMAILMAWRGIPLSMSTAPIADLAINAAGDFSVYFFSAFLSAYSFGRILEDAIARTHARESIVVFVDCVLNSVSFSPLMFSRFEPVRELGWMMVVMLLAALVGLLCFVPSLLPATIAAEEE